MLETADRDFSHDLSEVRALALRPTPANLVELVTRLEAVAGQMERIKAAALNCGTCAPQLAANLRKLRDEMSHTQRMLSSAAAFYNGLANARTAGATGYESTGLLRSAASCRRVLAQL